MEIETIEEAEKKRLLEMTWQESNALCLIKEEDMLDDGIEDITGYDGELNTLNFGHIKSSGAFYDMEKDMNNLWDSADRYTTAESMNSIMGKKSEEGWV